MNNTAVSVTCWYYDVRALSDPERFSRGLAALPWDDRRKQVTRYRFDRDRRLCLGAGLLLAFALRCAGAEDMSLARLSDGKPVLAVDQGVHFNLSHSGTLAVCAVSGQPVGVDAESLQRSDPDVERLCFQPGELEWLSRASDRDRAFTRLWTRKESYLKLLGTGLSRSPKSFSALPGDMPDGCAFSEREIDGCMVCVCTPREEAVCFEAWRFE